MWSLSTDAQIVLTRSRTVSIRATAFTAAYGAVSDLPVVSGSIGVDSTSQGRRTGTVGIGNAAYWPDDPLDVLSPIGTELFVEYGILLPTGTYEWVPLIRGPITDATRQQPITGNTALTITVADRSQKVAEARFDQPAQTVSGATTVAEIRRLVTEVLPSVTVTDQTGNTRVAPVLDMERERWADGIEKLADSIGAEAFADPAGAFVIRDTPTLDAVPVWLIAAGEGGVLLKLDEKLTRDRTYNRVVASGQRTDGTPPVWAAVSDTNPASPTYIDGPFGIKPRFYASPLLTTTQQCTLAATSLLARYTGMWGSVTITALVNPALDAGDVILVRDDTGRTSAHIVDTLSIPLTPGESQQIGTRSQALPEETES
jgi:hypothetical protein